MPYPPYRGDKLKIYNLANELCKNHELHLITIAENQEDVSSINELLKPTDYLDDNENRRFLFHSIQFEYRPKWKSALSAIFGIFGKRPLQVAYFRSKSFADRLNKTLKENQYDAIHIQHLRMAQYFETEVPNHAILDLPDAFSLYWKRRKEKAKNPAERWFMNMEFQRLARYEQLMLPKFSKVLVCSSEDQQYLQNLGITNVSILPNGVNLNLFFPQGPEKIVRNRILFTGNMDYAPNIDAVQYFVNDILPKIIIRYPDTQFIIAGQRPVKSVLDLASESIKVTGFIENLSVEYAKAHIVVSPLRIGAGTQNKVLEALAMNLAVVCTKVGFDGLGLKNGQGILLAVDSSDFADKVILFLDSIELRDKMGLQGGNYVRSNFAWQVISKQLMNYFNELK